MEEDRAALIVDPDKTAWDETVDVLVVGFGGTGACAAIEAADQGASVLAVDRFTGGGATEASGGVYYGGGTRFQREAGFDDTSAEMFKYLKMETGDVVSESTLKRFCEDSASNLEWLVKLGMTFSGTFSPTKTSFPANGVYLYYSGNEYAPRYAEIAKPAPRGHKLLGPRMMGKRFYSILRDAARERGVRIWTDSPVTRLLLGPGGAVVGAEIRQFASVPAALKRHRRIYRNAKRMVGIVTPAGAAKAFGKVAEVESGQGSTVRVRARRGVVLSTGGFIFNREMVKHYAPLYADAQPLGTPGCDGSGIRLGQSAGGTTRRMESVMASRLIAPPTAPVHGLIVNADGHRIIAEDAYACTLGRMIAEAPGSVAWLILDRTLYWDALRNSLPGNGRLVLIHCLPSLMSLLFGSKKASTAEALAGKCGLPAQHFLQTLADYNRIGRGEVDDPMGKKKEYCHELTGSPLYAVNISLRSKTAPLATLTLGGLDVDEDRGNVKRADGTQIEGLYAAGRTAAGVASNYYLSGLSIADVVFSGRRAGYHAAQTKPPIRA
jgi:3-oxo-5alpha-steroid 4-dehydrogenase